MKILLLNPNIDAEHNLAKTLRARGAALLFPSDAEEAWQMLQLHGSSVELAIVHREGLEGKSPGIDFINRVKSDPSFSDLPLILTTSTWGDAECAEHQQSAEGVNAYLQEPFLEHQLIELIEAVMGRPLKLTQSPPPPPKLKPVAAPSSAPSNAPSFEDPSGIVLEDTSAFYLNGRPEPTGLSIQLEAPDLEPESPQRKILPQENDFEPQVSADVRSKEADPEPAFTSPEEIPIETPAQTEKESPSQPTLSFDSLPAYSAPLTVDQTGVESLNEGFDVLATAPPAVSPQSLETDSEMAQELPYLFKKGRVGEAGGMDPALLFTSPVGDAVVPGGAAQAPDLETVKKYLLLREQDVAALSNQLKAAHEHATLQENIIREERAKNAELTHLATEQKRKLDDFEKQKKATIDSLQSEINELNFQIKARSDKARILENQVREYTEQMEQLKDRVRQDIRKIRVREKELENRLEIVKKDSEALISAREGKIIELKRKLDLLEFNMDLLQEQYTREKDNSAKLREKLDKAAQVVRVAGGLLEAGKGGPKASEGPKVADEKQDSAESGVIEREAG